ncbi:uncharacterized protein LOC131221104 [Magnolia sinica]|uniref:uncharacterized protein LOC131221104 n=1 Tax=Magnolia sinica TaxID=86752 RepID=UPI00265B268C|nr:uncharacterized protein LOC131221104 [Magnolia sinica]
MEMHGHKCLCMIKLLHPDFVEVWYHFHWTVIHDFSHITKSCKTLLVSLSYLFQVPTTNSNKKTKKNIDVCNCYLLKIEAWIHKAYVLAILIVGSSNMVVSPKSIIHDCWRHGDCTIDLPCFEIIAFRCVYITCHFNQCLRSHWCAFKSHWDYLDRTRMGCGDFKDEFSYLMDLSNLQAICSSCHWLHYQLCITASISSDFSTLEYCICFAAILASDVCIQWDSSS